MSIRSQDENLHNPPRQALYEIDVLDVLRDLWGARYLIISLIMASVVVSVIVVALTRPVYTASMLVGPAEQSDQRGISSSLGQIAGAASLLGIGLGGGNATFSKYMAVLQSYELAGAVFRHDELKPAFYGPSWDPKTRTFSRPSGVVFEIKDFVKSLIGLPRWSVPQPASMRNILLQALRQTPDQQKGLFMLSVQARSPAQAQHLLDVVYKEADNIMRASQRKRSRNRIEYLGKELEHTAQQDQRLAMTNALSMEEQRMMMASVDETVAIEIIDPPAVAPVPTSPNARLTLALFAFLAILTGSVIAVVHGLRQRNAMLVAIAEGGVPPAPLTADTMAGAWLRRRYARWGQGRSSVSRSASRTTVR